MLPSVKPDLVICDYHLTLINSPNALRDERAEFYEGALEFVNDFRLAGVRCALVSLGTDTRPVYEKLEPIKAWDLFAYHRFPLPLAGMDIDEAKQATFRDIIQDVAKQLGRDPVVWLIGDKDRDFLHADRPLSFNIAANDHCQAYDALDEERDFFIANFPEARAELAALLKPEGLTPSIDLG